MPYCKIERICVKCKWYKENTNASFGHLYGECLRPSPINIITGERRRFYSLNERAGKTERSPLFEKTEPCGFEGRYWEPKDVKTWT